MFYPFRGGTETHMLELGEALVKQGVEVHVVTAKLKGTRESETIRGIKVHRVPSEIIRLAGLYPPPLVVCPNFLKYLRDIDAIERFDLFHLHGRWFPDFTLVRKHCKETGKPFLLTVHNARPIGISPFYTLFGSAYEMAVGKTVLKKADHLIAVSKWTANDVSKYNIPKNKFTVIYNAINASDFSFSHNPQVKKKLGMKPSDPLLVWVGRIIEQKGLKYLVQAMQQVTRVFPTAKLLVVGTGTELKKLKKQAAKLGLTDKIVFYGAENNRKTLNDLLRGCDLFVFPSIWEPFGMVITEAMASGLPVVATKTGGIPEIVDNKTGWLVPVRNSRKLADAIVTALKDSHLLRKKGLAGRKVAETKFNWKKAATETIAVYKKALREPRKKQLSLDELIISSKKIGKMKKPAEVLREFRKMWKRATE